MADDSNLEFTLHDADLLSLEKSAGGDFIELKFADVIGRRIFARILGCDLFRVVDFGPQNIASRLRVIKGSDANQQFAAERLIWASSTVDSKSFLEPSRLAYLLELISMEKRTLVALEPSVGAEIVVIGQSVNIALEK